MTSASVWPGREGAPWTSSMWALRASWLRKSCWVVFMTTQPTSSALESSGTCSQAREGVHGRTCWLRLRLVPLITPWWGLMSGTHKEGLEILFKYDSFVHGLPISYVMWIHGGYDTSILSMGIVCHKRLILHSFHWHCRIYSSAMLITCIIELIWNWLFLWRLVPWINHFPLACWSTFWKSSLK